MRVGVAVAGSRPYRQFAFIVHADVVGSTRLVQLDEARAHARIQGTFDHLAEAVTAYGGAVSEIRGDALVAVFERASDAVEATLSFQLRNTRRNAQLTDEIRPAVRIGIGMGEVIVADHTVTGAGVVLAQRLEQLADSGCVVIQGAIQEAIPHRLPFQYTSLGEQQVKGFEEAVRVVSVSVKPGESIPEPEAHHGSTGTTPQVTRRRALIASVAILLLTVAGVLAWLQPWDPGVEPMAARVPAKPSIAVLPFDNLSGDPEQEYFSDGISEDIITDLSQLANLDVIARNSSFTYKNSSVKVQEIGQALGVQYLLEGSVRKGGNRLRITAQLVDTSNGHHLWADRYDRELTDVFTLQDEITQQIVTALSIQLSDDEKRSIGRLATNSFEAYDLFLQARESDRFTEEGVDQAVEKYRQAIALDPGFARAYGALAITLARQVAVGYTDSPVVTNERALELAREAVSIDPQSPHAQWALGYVYMRTRQFDQAIEALQQALQLSPNFADGFALLALIRNNLGQAEEAIRLINKAMALNPYYSRDYLYNLGRAYYALGDYDNAVQALEKALERNQTSREIRIYLAASLVQLGRQDDAEWEIAQLQVSDPGYTLSHLEKAFPFGDDSLRDRFFNDLRAAGMAE
jgi:TolB-like protein/class 3 adenylate cyclase